jgi:hypothetical protein
MNIHSSSTFSSTLYALILNPILLQSNPVLYHNSQRLDAVPEAADTELFSSPFPCPGFGSFHPSSPFPFLGSWAPAYHLAVRSLVSSRCVYLLSRDALDLNRRSVFRLKGLSGSKGPATAQILSSFSLPTDEVPHCSRGPRYLHTAPQSPLLHHPSPDPWPGGGRGHRETPLRAPRETQAAQETKRNSIAFNPQGQNHGNTTVTQGQRQSAAGMNDGSSTRGDGDGCWSLSSCARQATFRFCPLRPLSCQQGPAPSIENALMVLDTVSGCSSVCTVVGLRPWRCTSSISSRATQAVSPGLDLALEFRRQAQPYSCALDESDNEIMHGAVPAAQQHVCSLHARLNFT